MKRTFYKDIEKFNKMYKLPGDGSTQLHGVDMLKWFKSILLEEVEEVEAQEWQVRIDEYEIYWLEKRHGNK